MPSKNIKSRYRGKKNNGNISINFIRNSSGIRDRMAYMAHYNDRGYRENQKRNQGSRITKKDKRGDHKT